MYQCVTVRVSERQQYVFIKALALAWLEDHHGIGAPSAPLLLLSCQQRCPQTLSLIIGPRVIPSFPALADGQSKVHSPEYTAQCCTHTEKSDGGRQL